MGPVGEFLARVEARRSTTSARLDPATRARFGQFFTPHDAASHLAAMVRPDEPWRLLDPGAGVGSLAASLIARWLVETSEPQMRVTAYELDPKLIGPLRATLDEAKSLAGALGRNLEYEVREADFILDPPEDDANVVLMNPPYGKLGVRRPERQALERMTSPVRVTNLYAAFLVRAVRALRPTGQLVAITPRSFANGPYFKDLRADLFARASFELIHVFEARDKVFADAEVLQENLIFSMRRGATPGTVVVSSSTDANGTVESWECPHSQIVHPSDPVRFVRLPLNEQAIAVAEEMMTMPATLADLGLSASTGRVVDFRARDHLRACPEPGTVPLVYPHNVRDGLVHWPVVGRKPQALIDDPATERLQLPNEAFVLVKRFTAKEEPRRVVAALSLPEHYGDAATVGFENHLNVFHKAGCGLDRDLAAGLTDYLNSELVDAYIRQFNGHTQINATDLRELRYPTLDQLRATGRSLAATPPRRQELEQLALDGRAKAA